MALEYYRDGLLGDEMIEGYARGIHPLFENPVVVEWWEKEGQSMYSQELDDLVSKQTVA
jgi:Leu/Phe-tRNA-protein transferase